LSVISTRLTIDLLGNAFIGYMTGLLTLAILIFGEVIPKNLALAHNEAIAVFSAPIINAFIIVFSPFVYFITLISSFITRYLSPKSRDPLNMDAILRLVRYAEAKGVLEDYERDMVHAVFRLDQQNISSIMTHRTEVFSLDKNSRIVDVIDLINSKNFSRIPVYEDNPENIKGIVLVKDIVKNIGCREDKKYIKLEDIMLPPFFVSDNKKIRDALFMMQKEKRNMAIILDEYSGLSGIVTVEDIIEEIVGELYDEDDSPEHEKITITGENTYIVTGSSLISTVNDSLGINLPIGRFSQTIGGFIIDELGRIPKRKDKISVKGAEIIVDSVSMTKINNVKIILSK